MAQEKHGDTPAMVRDFIPIQPLMFTFVHGIFTKLKQ